MSSACNVRTKRESGIARLEGEMIFRRESAERVRVVRNSTGDRGTRFF